MSKQIKKSHRIGLYVRVSTEEQAENPEGSIRNQEERLRMTVKLKNMEGHFGDIQAIYIDRAKSGKDTNRPELQKMLMAIRKRELDLIMVSELSRISRSIKDFSEIWQMMQDNGCGFQSLRENFDTTTAAGEMVLFTVANIAQFERRQISERVSANFNIRSQRGLFNGGAISYGYKRIQDKPGFLEIDEEAAVSVRAAFQALQREGTLAQAAAWLNEQGFRVKPVREGGGIRTRLGYFTVKNLGQMLRSKFYIGVKNYTQNGEIKETEAVWPPIIDRDTFTKVNEILDKNHRRNKDAMVDRYPYQLSGFVYCKTCGDRMIGKSAHGNGGKIGYYEHASMTVPGANVPQLEKNCFPYRVLAKHLEPDIWGEILKLFNNEKFAVELLNEAKRAHKVNPGSKELEKFNHVIFNVDRQLEVLAERLATLPQTISPTPIYKQMEKLEERKQDAQKRTAELQSAGIIKDEPAELRDFQRFIKAVGEILKKDDGHKIRMKVIRYLVHKINIIPDGFEVHFKVGESYVKILTPRLEGWDSGSKSSNFSVFKKSDMVKKLGVSSSCNGTEPVCLDSGEILDKKNALVDLTSTNATRFYQHFGSNTCQSGAPGRT